MSQTSQEPPRGATSLGKEEAFEQLAAPLTTPARPPSTAFQGWAYFGAVVMALMGMFWAVVGLVSLFDEEYFTVRTNELLAFHSFAPWGWAHLLGGLLAVAAGLGILLRGSRSARIAGILVAGLSAIVNLGFAGATPVWATLVIALDLVIIYALTVHGWELDRR